MEGSQFWDTSYNFSVWASAFSGPAHVHEERDLSLQLDEVTSLAQRLYPTDIQKATVFRVSPATGCR